jgi:hypothetical protein
MDPRIPATAWRYQKMTDLNPERDAAQKGSLNEYMKLRMAIERYYRDNGLWFDQKAFAKDFKLFKTILNTDLVGSR